MSLPLPKPVGIEVKDDLLCLRFNRERTVTDYQSQIADRLTAELPEGCRLLSVSTSEAKVSSQPREATYILTVPEECINEKLKTKIANLLASETLILQRKTDKRGGIRDVDVRPFLKSVELADRDIIVECVVTPAGSIRIDEIVNLLELDASEFTAPIRRTKVQWQ